MHALCLDERKAYNRTLDIQNHNIYKHLVQESELDLGVPAEKGRGEWCFGVDQI